MAAGAEGVAAAHYHRVLVEQIHQLGEGQEISLLLVGLQPPVQLQNGLQRPDGQDMAPSATSVSMPGKIFRPFSSSRVSPVLRLTEAM